MKNYLAFFIVPVLIMITALPTRSIQAYQPDRSLDSSGFIGFSAQTLPVDPAEPQKSNTMAAASTTCHFGISIIDNWADVDLSTLGVGNYLDWDKTPINHSVAGNIEYFRVLNLFDVNMPGLRKDVPGLIAKGLGATWIIGNEPDSQVTYQNHLSAETYADYFFEMATMIRQNDPTAKIGFGAIMQPTPIRIHYLDLALNHLAELAGGKAQAHALIDFYAIHAYILNEQPLFDVATGKSVSWGAGVPIGYDPATWPAPEVIHTEWGETYKTYDINIFKARLINFRQWMVDQGEEDKPLWVTEFGNLFPSEGNPYFYVSDTDTANFMTQVYDFMLGYKDPQLGYAPDDDRLVQKWTWFSLNDKRTRYGGSLFDPDTHQMTLIGERFIQYDPSLTDVPVENPDVYVVPGSSELTGLAITAPADQVYYKVSVKVGNNRSSDRHTNVSVNLYDGKALIGSTPVNLPRCGGTAQVTFLLKGLRPNEIHNFSAEVSVLPGNGNDTDVSNNLLPFAPITLPGPTTSLTPVAYMPVILK